MEWPELDALADELRRTLARGSLRGCPALGEVASRTLDAERVARITLADIDHVRAWERSDAFPRSGRVGAVSWDGARASCSTGRSTVPTVSADDADGPGRCHGGGASRTAWTAPCVTPSRPRAP